MTDNRLPSFTRRALASLLCGAAFAGAFTGVSPASAQSWPDRSITWIVPFPAGGGTDTFARPMAAQLEQQLGQKIVIDNRGGAGGTVGASAAAKMPGDGYTFFVGAAHHTIAPALYPKLDYDLEKDFIPIAVLAQPPQVIVVNPEKVQARTLKEFVDFAKANPGRLNYASAGNGTTHHLAGELFKLSAGVNLVHVPYRGAGPAMQDLLAGHVQVMFDGLGTSSSQIAGGKLHAIALAAPARSATVPNVPTTTEAGMPDYRVSTWYALWAPKGTPAAVIERMQREIKAAHGKDNIREIWAKAGSDIPTLAGAEFGKFITAEIARWGKVVKDSNVKLD